MIEDFGNWKKEVRNIHKKQEKSCEKFENYLELRGIEPRTFHMRSEHSTTELQPRRLDKKTKKPNKKHCLIKTNSARFYASQFFGLFTHVLPMCGFKIPTTGVRTPS